MITGIAACGGCGKDAAPRVVFGQVLCGTEVAEKGTVRFVPIQGTTGPVSTSEILNGEYRLDSRGGVPLGTYRVEVTCLRKTGKKVPDRAVAGAMTEEWVPMSDGTYAEEKSPLQVEVKADSDGKHDLTVPRRPK